MKSLPFLRVITFLLTSLVISLMFVNDVLGHESVWHQDNPRNFSHVHWSQPNISEVITAGYPLSFGLFAFSGRQEPRLVFRKHESKQVQCIEANFLAFDIDDEFAFDLNEDVEIELSIDASHNSLVSYGYDKHASANANGNLEFDNSDGLVSKTVSLPSARFVNRGMGGSDFVLASQQTMWPAADVTAGTPTTFVLCGLKLKRSYETKGKQSTKSVTLNFFDNESTSLNEANLVNNKQKTPVRFGLYDESGSLVLSPKGTVPIKYYETTTSVMALSAFYPPFQYWPHENRYFYYTDGQVTAELPIGRYTLVASKGPEYKLVEQQFEVTAEGHTDVMDITMHRWRDMPALGWYSGDVHIHMKRDQQDNSNIMSVLAAEDLHFSNLLVMSSPEHDYFKQYAFGKDAQHSHDDNHIVPGIEGPRTAFRGHTIALNIQEQKPIEQDYFLYHKYFDFYRKQGAATGYAHVGSGEFHARWGLALDVPFGLVDFVEIMQAGRLRTEIWYQFLNLGFKLAPAAGSDFPYFDQPGAVRSYVKASPEQELYGWYENLKQGKTFVSNGPVVDLNVSGVEPGGVLNTTLNKPITVAAAASINTDFDKLASLELVYCGEVVKRVKTNNKQNGAELSLNWQLPAGSQGWLAMRAKGEDFALAHSSAVYLHSGDNKTFCPDKYKADANIKLSRLKALRLAQIEKNSELEYWDAANMAADYKDQKDEMMKRVKMAEERYKEMLVDYE